ncbi:zinc finger BED domain-containing protein RICESLEEPER 2-like [Dorcoceras hygrometricum]|uniref:Zinc finger BED domain-containing protein RICESLEEPER 2-like n=1 Tax=Dorcoceras hygrometricum TaxID=472368 RepID=A0A2Z7D2X1_9LAMI|nr:zinc finger BED domain-containing protein RICESLEEPER 2-like [Dorcoceras hygrometricum]
MDLAGFWCELKLLLADIARSERLSEEVTHVSQHFGALTIDSADALVKRDQQMMRRRFERFYATSRCIVLKRESCYQLLVVCLRELLAAGLTLRRRFDKLERCRFEMYERLLLRVVAADFTKGKERIAADRLLLISSIDLSESAGEFLVELETSREDLYFPTNLGGCVELERERETAEQSIVPEKSNAIVEAVTTGYECLPPSCDGLTGPDDHGPMISRLIDRGIEA